MLVQRQWILAALMACVMTQATGLAAEQTVNPFRVSRPARRMPPAQRAPAVAPVPQCPPTTGGPENPFCAATTDIAQCPSEPCEPAKHPETAAPVSTPEEAPESPWHAIAAAVLDGKPVADDDPKTTDKGSNPFRGSAAKVVPVAAAEEVELPPPTMEQTATPVAKLGIDIALPAGKMPPRTTTPGLAPEHLAGDVPRPWPEIVYQWEAAATCHNPLRFEETNAERYGYACCGVAQPFVSTAHFFGTLPALPYLVASNWRSECQYTLGHYRPGSCVPYRRHCWPCDGLGASVEAGTIVGLILLIP